MDGVARVGSVGWGGGVRRVRWEPPGAVGVGAEWVLEGDGAVWVEQVKDRAHRWTIRKLKTEHVLDLLLRKTRRVAEELTNSCRLLGVVVVVV